MTVLLVTLIVVGVAVAIIDIAFVALLVGAAFLDARDRHRSRRQPTIDLRTPSSDRDRRTPTRPER